MKEIKSLSARTIFMMISTILVNAISLITAPVITRIMSTADFGIFSLFTSWISIFSIICGGQTYGTLNNAKIEYDQKTYPDYCFNVFLISTIGCIFAGGIVLINADFFSGVLHLPQKCLLWLILGAYGTYAINFLSGYLIIEKKAVQNLIVSFIVVLFSTLLSIILIVYIPFFEGYFGRILGYSIIYFIAAVCSVLYFLRFANFKINIGYWKFCLPLSVPLIVHSLSDILMSQSDRIMLMSQKGESVVGVYSFCYTMALPVSVLSGAINSAWTPEYYELMVKKKIDEIKEHYSRQQFIMTAMTCGYMLVAPEAVKILSVKEYWGGISIIPLVVVGYYFSYLYLFPANYEFYSKKTKYIAVSTTMAAIVNIILNFALIPYYGMHGAAVATIISYILLFLAHDIIVRIVLKGYCVKLRFYLKGIIPVAVCFTACNVFAENMIIRWMMGTVIALSIIIKIKKQRAII